VNLGMKFGLGILGFSEADIATIDKAIPSAERLVEAEKEFGALYDKYRTDISAVVPAAQIILAYAKKV
jgi:hypothetical protein